MVLITIVTGAYKPTYNWGGAHCIYLLSCYTREQSFFLQVKINMKVDLHGWM